MQRCSLVSESLDVDPKPIIDGLEICNTHQEEALESLTEVGGRGIDRVLAFVHQIEDLNDDRVLKKHVHVHFKHDIKTVLFLCHVKDGLSHELIQLRDMLLSREVVGERIHDVLVQHRTFRCQRVDLFPINFPRNSVNEKGVFDGIELTEHRVFFELF